MAKDNTEYPGDINKTIFIPRPGGRGPAAATPMPPSTPPPPAPSFDSREYQTALPSGGNPLISASTELVALPTQFLTMVEHHDVAGLRKQVLEEIREFENKARTLGINPDVINTCRFVLCTFIDEAVLNTVWGSSSAWANQSLLSTLHNEVSGGETFFVILDRLLRDPNGSVDLLELMFLCISLGFKGRYTVMDRGHEKLEDLRNMVFEHIRRRRGEVPPELSPHWQSQSNQRASLRHYVPLWVVVAVAGALLLAIFVGFTMVLHETTNPVHEALEDIGKLPTIESPIND